MEAGAELSIVEEQGTLLYVVRDRKGREVMKGDLPAALLRERARRQKKSLQDVALSEAKRRLGRKEE